MQIGKDITLRLTLVDDSGENAEAVVSALRNGGIAIRPLRPLDGDELARMVASQPMDLVVAARDARTIPLASVLEHVDASGKDIPVIVISNTLSEAELLEDMARGARAQALRGKDEHLLSVVRREWSDLDARRALRRLEGNLRETERRCDALISSSRDPIAYIHEGMHIRANEAYLEMLGFESFEDIEGLSLLDLVAPQYVAEFKNLLKQMSKGEAPPPRFEMEARNLDGDSFPATLEFTAATYEGESCVQVVFRRREELDPELAREVEELRQRDVVTGLLNRPAFLRELENAVSLVARGEKQYGLLLVEPDHFQRLLPEIGIGSADELIAAMARRLGESLDAGAIAARFGERVFAVLMPGNHAHTLALSQKLQAAFAASLFSVGSRTVPATASVGGVQIGEKIASVAPVLTRATESLQTAIGLGGNRIEIFDPGAADRAEEERVQNWIKRLQDALVNDDFLLHYQPVVSLQGEPGEVYEALLRLDSSGELVTPNSFMAIAEENHLLDAIDRWVVNRAIEVLAERQRAGQLTKLIVKVSPASFGDERLLQLIAKQLAQHGVSGQCLWLSTPEAKVFTHLGQAQSFQAGASKLGCKVGLEQFGAGLDSFQLLTHFKPAFLKIDRVFTQELTRTPEHQTKIREIAERAQSQGILTIAEHVQDAATMSFLFTATVDYVEGNFLAEPSPQMTYDFS